jgi:hypothetical protein
VSKAKQKKSAAVGTQVMAWQDDPNSGAPPINRPVPDLRKRPLKFKIKGPTLKPGIYTPGTPDFRYWTAAEALRRGGDYWARLLSVKQWQPGSVLSVGLDEGEDFNAYYDRKELAFFHGTAGKKVIYSGESPDVVCHELGHACLDAHRPELFDAPFIEVGSFHESFGDMSAILSALQLPSVRQLALASLKSDGPSFLSRLAEQLGWAIRQQDPQAVDKDCLRNACNDFKYVDPQTLPDSAPATKLCAEVHSFSRVFTGAFYEILSGMLGIRAKSADADDLANVAVDYGELLIAATAAAPVLPNFYAQVAAHMIDADTAQFAGKYRSVLTKVFVDRKIISSAAVTATQQAKGKQKKNALRIAAHATLPPSTPVIHKVVLSGKEFGQRGKLIVRALSERKRFLIASAAVMQEKAMPTDDIDAAAHRFVTMLFAHDRVRLSDSKKTVRSMVRHKSEIKSKIKTHALVKTRDGLQLKRLLFLCGCRQFHPQSDHLR